MAKILFGYRSLGCYPNPCEYISEFKITDRGTLILRITSRLMEHKFTHKISLSEQVISDMSMVLMKYQDRIKKFPPYIENYLVCDGTHQCFTLLGKHIGINNIGRYTPQMLKRIKAELGEGQYHNAILQNELLEIVAEIYPILRPHGMKVSRWEIFECDWPPLAKLATFASNLTSDLFTGNRHTLL